MIYKILVIASTLASVAGTSIALGQNAVHFGIGAGIAIPAGTFRDSYRLRENVLATIAVGPENSPVGFRLDYSYNEFSSRHIAVGPGPSKDMHLNIATANLVIAAPAGAAKPYIVGGGGLYNFHDPISAKTVNAFGFNGGIGCTFPLFTSAGFIEARYHRIVGQTSSKQVVPVTLGILF